MLSYKEQIRNKLNINTDLKNDCPSISYLKAAAFGMLFKQQSEIEELWTLFCVNKFIITKRAEVFYYSILEPCLQF